ncbi:hypothetical protein ACHAWF_014311 [Thalassiosira exigua]
MHSAQTPRRRIQRLNPASNLHSVKCVCSWLDALLSFEAGGSARVRLLRSVCQEALHQHDRHSVLAHPLPSSFTLSTLETISLVPATSILLILGTISAYTFHLLGRLTAVANNETAKDGGPAVTGIGQLWDREVGTSTSWLVGSAVALTCFCTCLAYSIILGDTFVSLAKTIGLEGLYANRRFHVAAVSLLGVYPLCCLKSLAALAPVSIGGVVGILVTCAVMTMRALPGGGYSSVATAAATSYLPSLPPDLRPSFGVAGLRGLKSLLVMSSMTATAYLVHVAGPEFYQTLRRPTPKRFGKLSAIGFGGTALISACIMSVGFLTFGGASKGMILNNYSTLDGGATLCRLLMAVSLLGSYAFMSNAMKKAYYGIFRRGREITDEVHYRTTRWSVGILTALALLVDDAGFVVSATGAVLGSCLIYMIPSYMFLKSTKRRVEDGSLQRTRTLTVERWWNRGLIALGAFLGSAGLYMSVLHSFFPHMLNS